MPPKKTKGKKTKEEEPAIEGEITNLKTTMEAMRIQAEASRLQAEENHAKVIELLIQNRGKTIVAENFGIKRLQGEALEEFRQSVKKVELPMFNGEDPAGWITRAKIYFSVQETSEAVGDVEQYICNFECLIEQAPKLHDDQYFAYFLHGLKEEIWGRLRSLQALGTIPRGRLMNVARAIKMEIGTKERDGAVEEGGNQSRRRVACRDPNLFGSN
ncbi:hypothetical protein SESBI_28988 [Sesbania bispinosa]|nr:hypothetical protein SESBI_28988 [Sesbania bispinosa]